MMLVNVHQLLHHLSRFTRKGTNLNLIAIDELAAHRNMQRQELKVYTVDD